jgi:hypothetical protein
MRNVLWDNAMIKRAWNTTSKQKIRVDPASNQHVHIKS